MNPPACVACSHDSMRSVTLAGSDFWQCSSCGFGSLRRTVEQGDYWPEGSSGGRIPPYWTTRRKRYFESALELLERAGPGKRLLDIGGGPGYFAQLAIARTWDAFSLDTSPEATSFAVDSIGRERALTDLLAVEDESFDVVTMWCVVAHLRDPAQLLEQSARILRPGGLIWITTPNFAFQRRYGWLRARVNKPIDFAAEDHVSHFTSRALQAILRRAGYGGISWRYAGVTEFCAMTKDAPPVTIALKRVWNRGAYTAVTAGLPNAMSELQALSRIGQALT